MANRCRSKVSSSIRLTRSTRAQSASSSDAAPAMIVEPVEEPSITREERAKIVMEEARSFLAADLVSAFESGKITKGRYSKTYLFEDPLTKFDTLDGFIFYLDILKAIFTITFDLHSTEITGPDEITARWTMGTKVSLVPWQPALMFTGVSIFRIDLSTGIVLSQIDEWDELEHNRFPSIEAIVLMMKGMIDPLLATRTGQPLDESVEAHSFVTLMKKKEFELRFYPPFLSVEVEQPSGSAPTSGSGFTSLARYISKSGNREKLALDMTSPVLSTIDPNGNSQSMAFVMEPRFKSMEQLPTPTVDGVRRREDEGGFFAAVSFSGWPLDNEVIEKERELRRALQQEGIKARPGSTLARFSGPLVPPMLRKNTLLIELDNTFVWPPDSSPLAQIRWRKAQK